MRNPSKIAALGKCCQAGSLHLHELSSSSACAGCWDANLQEEEDACGIGSGSCADDRCGSGCPAGALGAGLCICALATSSAFGILGGPPGGSSAAHGLGVAAQEGAHHHCEKGQVLLTPIVPGNSHHPFCTAMFLQLFGWVLLCRIVPAIITRRILLLPSPCHLAIAPLLVCREW